MEERKEKGHHHEHGHEHDGHEHGHGHAETLESRKTPFLSDPHGVKGSVNPRGFICPSFAFFVEHSSSLLAPQPLCITKISTCKEGLLSRN